MSWSLGACFACPRCLLRGVWSKCPRCGDATLDLTRAPLDDRWSALPAYAAGYGLTSPRSVRSLKVIRRLSAFVTFVCCLGPILGPWQKTGSPPTLLELGLSVLVSLVFAFPLFWFFSLYLLFIAHLMRGLAVLTSLAARITPLGRRDFSVLARLTRWLSRPLLPQIELWTMEHIDGPSQRATLVTPLRIDFVRDGWGWLERFDAVIATPPLVKLESGEEHELAVAHGAVTVNPTAPRRDGASLPGWLEVPVRQGVRFHREFPAGTVFEFRRTGADFDVPRVHLVL